MRLPLSAKLFAALGIVLMQITSCNEVIDDRIPRMPVSVDISNEGLWSVYGVNGFGDFRYFIYGDGQWEPAGFPYISQTKSHTGFGGVLLIAGQSFTSGGIEPLAYDLACPVERQRDIRIFIDTNNYDAVCPKCGSRYSVVEAGGSPVAGPALDYGYGLRRYSVYPTVNRGYMISDY